MAKIMISVTGARDTGELVVGRGAPWATLGHDRHFGAKALEGAVRLSLCQGGGGGHG